MKTAGPSFPPAVWRMFRTSPVVAYFEPSRRLKRYALNSIIRRSDVPRRRGAGCLPVAMALAELGLSSRPAPSAIRRAFRQRSKQTHPDGGGTAEEFARTVAAYRSLVVAA